MVNLEALLTWAHENSVRVTLKFIPDHRGSPFVVEAQVPFIDSNREHPYDFVRRKGKTVEDVCARFLDYVNTH